MHEIRKTSPRRRVSSLLATTLAAGLATLSAGCFQQILLLGYLIAGPPSIEPPFEIMTKESLTDKNVTVAVVCVVPKEVEFLSTVKIDQEIARYVSHRLAVKKIEVVTPDRVRRWLIQNPEWIKPDEIGKYFKTTYVIFIDVQDFNLYEKSSQTIFRGRAEVNVEVWKMDDDGEGDKIFSQRLTSQYPLAVGKPVTSITYTIFQRKYLARLSEEIGRMFYEHYNGDDMIDVM